jgi:hypothetical protein
MRQVLSRRYAVTFSTGDSGYVYSDQVPPGYVVHVSSCLAYCAQREASDDAIIGFTDAGQEIIITAKATLAAARGIAAEADFYVGEGDKIFAYFPDADDTDVLELHINGTLLTVTDFEGGME